MCYSCSANCDNCYPKMVACPECGFVNYLKQNACAQCGAMLDERTKQRARDLWGQGVRFGKSEKPAIAPLSRTNSPFASAR